MARLANPRTDRQLMSLVHANADRQASTHRAFAARAGRARRRRRCRRRQCVQIGACGPWRRSLIASPRHTRPGPGRQRHGAAGRLAQPAASKSP
jgi:hypothetical protein